MMNRGRGENGYGEEGLWRAGANGIVNLRKIVEIIAEKIRVKW